MLKSTVLNAIQVIRESMADLLMPATIARRAYSAHVPGASPIPTETSTSVVVVLTGYTAKEVDHDRIRASDYKGIILPAVAGDVLNVEVNDVANVPALSKNFRVLSAEKTMVGDTVGLVVAQLRV